MALLGRKLRLLALPFLGEDLFAGSFQQKLQAEVSGGRPWQSQSLDRLREINPRIMDQENLDHPGEAQECLREISGGGHCEAE